MLYTKVDTGKLLWYSRWNLEEDSIFSQIITRNQYEYPSHVVRFLFQCTIIHSYFPLELLILNENQRTN